MAKFDPNNPKWADEPTRFKIWEAGKHLVVIASASVQVSGGGKSMVHVHYEDIGPASADLGSVLDYQFYMVDGSKAQSWYAQLCRAVNPKMRVHDPEDQDELNELLFDKVLAIKVDHEESTWTGNDGKERTKTKARARGHRTLDSAEKSALSEKWGNTMKPGSEQSPAQSFEEDDIPF